MTHRIAAALIRSGVGPGDRVGVLSGNHPLALITMLAVARADATYVPLNPNSTASKMAPLVELTGARVLLYKPVLGAKVAALREALQHNLMGIRLVPGDVDCDDA